MDNNTDGRCTLCPHPAETRDVYPYEGDLAEAPWTELRCHHRFHTHCFVLNIATREERDHTTMSCPACMQSVLPEETTREIMLRRTGHGYEDNERQRAHNLWNTNEAFREDLLQLKKFSNEARKFKVKYSKEASVLRREWKQLSSPSVEYLKSLKDKFVKKSRELDFRTEAMQAYNRFNKKNREIRHTYDTGYWGLGLLADIPGIPRFDYRYVYGLNNSRYMFRIRI